MTAVHPAIAPRARPGQSPIRVMIVDDSLVARSIFARVLGNHDRIEIVCEAEDSEAALAALDKLTVDIILLDIEMPKRSGLDALPDLQMKAGGARILVVSAFAEENGPAAIQALSLGACDTLAKPGRSGYSGRFSEQLVDKVIRLGSSAMDQTPAVQATGIAVSKRVLTRPKCIAIGSSTGGIPAIYEVIGNLHPALDCPVFITQHLPEAFMTFFARQLASFTKRTVKVAEIGEEVHTNHIYLAPGNAHLICRNDGGQMVIDHQQNYSASRYCPSVDAMFESLADVYGADVMAIIFSGMGNDGVNGARKLAKRNAQVLVQDVHTSVVWGMPGAVVREGLAAAIMAPTEMTQLLARLATGS